MCPLLVVPIFCSLLADIQYYVLCWLFNLSPPALFSSSLHPHSLPAPPSPATLPGSGKSPLRCCGCGTCSCLAHCLIGKHFGRKLSLRLLEACSSLPVQRVDLEEKKNKDKQTKVTKNNNMALNKKRISNNYSFIQRQKITFPQIDPSTHLQ